MGAFDCDEFVAACLEAVAEHDPVMAVHAVVERAVADPASFQERFPVPVDADDDGVLHRSSELFISNAMFPGGFATGIHDHLMAAVIGVWGGHESNQLFRRAANGLEVSGGRRVDEGEVLVLEPDAIHDVHAPRDRWSGAIHVYLGDLIAVERGQWATVASPRARFDGADLEDRWLAQARSTGLVAPT